MNPAALAEWVCTQRWFAGKGRPLADPPAEVVAESELAPGLRHLLVRVAFADGGEDHRYQMLLVERDEQVSGHDPYLVATQPGGPTPTPRDRSATPDATPDAARDARGVGDRRYVYDALHDSVGTSALLSLLRAGEPAGGLRFSRSGDIPDADGLALGNEQSNTSVVYGDVAILKVFRRLSPGVNPDLELTRALAEAGSTHIARPLAWIEGDLDGEPTTLAVLSEFLRSGTDGWKLALSSVRDLFAEGDLHADEVGGDFAGESERLGVATAEVHRMLADVLPTATLGRDEVAAEAGRMLARLDEAVASVPELEPYEEALRAAYAELEGYDRPVPVQRIHGDYHLGQVLRVDLGWVLLDFEGEPARPLPERVAPASPLRDVAGMLRSYDYAARYLLLDRADSGPLAYRADEWAERNRDAFCDGYESAAGSDPRADGVLLRAYELDKAVYEVMYEARHRPSWIPIPLAAVARLAGGAARSV